MLRVLLAFLLIPLPSFAQVRGNSVSVVPSISLGNIGAPSLTAPSIGSASLPLTTSMPSPAGLTVLTPAPSIVSPVPAAAAPLAVQAAAVKAIPSALSILHAAPSTPDKPAVKAETSSPAEEQKNASGAMFDGALNILMAGSEAVPFIKTGGLADVMDAVSRGLAARGHDVTMVLPKYRDLKTAGVELKQAGTVSVPIDGRVEKANLLVGTREGVRVVLLEHPEFFEREGGPYAAKHAALGLSAYDAAGIDDADERFGFYARAALEAMRALGIKPDVVHAHDWHAALIPSFLKSAYKDDPFFADTKTALTIHNIAFQGAFALSTALKFGFDETHIGHKGGANYLKSGIEHADAVTTVSPTYAREITENKLFSMGLEEPLRARDEVHGILNGIDPKLYDPATDPLLARNYGVEDAAEGKAENKAALQSMLGLDVSGDSPLFVVASRLAHQKGIDMIFDSASEIVRLGGQLAIMGTGDAQTEALRAALVLAFPGKVAAHPFDESAVRLLFAAADFLLMPSRFEPCGLSQLIAQRYGALPVVTSIGGLADTVTDLRDDPVNGTGLIVRAVASISLSRAIADAVSGYHHPQAFPLARRAAMTKNSSWEPSLDVYEALFRRLVGRKNPPAIASAKPSLWARYREYRARPGGLFSIFGKSVIFGSLASAAVPVVMHAAPAMKIFYALAAASMLLFAIIVPAGAAIWAVNKLRRTPRAGTALKRRIKIAAITFGAIVGLGVGVVPHKASGPLTELASSYLDLLESPRQKKHVRWISGGAVEDETIKALSANPVGREILDALRDRLGTLRMPSFFISNQRDSYAEHEKAFDGVYIGKDEITERGWTVEQFLADPALQRRLIREMESTIVHELTHAAQGRRAPWTRAYILHPVELEQEAFFQEMLYRFAELERDPAARNDGIDQWMIPEAAESIDGFLQTVAALYPDNDVLGDDQHFNSYIAAQRARWPAFRVRMYQVLAERATSSGSAKMYGKKAKAAAEEAGLPAPDASSSK